MKTTMRRMPFILLAFILVLHVVLAKDIKQAQTIEKPLEHQLKEIQSEKQHVENQLSEFLVTNKHQSGEHNSESQHSVAQPSQVQHSDAQPSEVKHSDTQTSELPHSDAHPSEVLHSDAQPSEVQHSDPQPSEIQHSDPQPTEVQHSDPQPSEVQNSESPNSEDQRSDSHHSEEQFSESHHSESQPTVVPHSDAHHSKKQVSTGRQFHPLPPYHPMLFQPPTGFEAIRRQFGGGLGSDLVMVGLISLPIIGLLTMGSASLGNLLGLGLSSSSNSKKSSSKRTKRSLKEKAADAVEYAKNLWNVMEQLEKAFEKYDLYQAECRLRVVCEAHHKDRRMGTWGQSILDLMRQQKELEGRELLPVSRFLFSNYAEAAQAGVRNENCAQLYTGCPRHLSYYLSAKEDQMENEVENGM